MSNTQATQPVGPFDDFVVRRPEGRMSGAKEFCCCKSYRCWEITYTDSSDSLQIGFKPAQFNFEANPFCLPTSQYSLAYRRGTEVC